MSENYYPGWNLDLRWFEHANQQRGPHSNVGRGARPTYPLSIHFDCFGPETADSVMLLVREVAMMLVMDRLTDKPDWHNKVFDDEIAAKWKTEALAWPDDDLWYRISRMDRTMEAETQPKMPKSILNQECVDYCILELRAKAEYFGRTGITPTLDAVFSIAKSDSLVSRELHLALGAAFAQLKADQASKPDWHPNTDGTVQDLVHPSMYPLVYGRSRFLPEELVGVDDAVDKWAGKGKVIPRRAEWGGEPGRDRLLFLSGNSTLHKSYWSTLYQWLPANVKFTDDGSVRFTSYINNLHPTKYRDIYGAIEKLIKMALPMWDQCLPQYRLGNYLGAGRRKARIVPDNPDDENPLNWDPKSVDDMLARNRAKGAEKAVEQPEPSETAGDKAAREEELHERWTKLREPVQSEPPPFAASQVSYEVDPAKTLREQFKDTGLQIIVKMASIELTPEKPEFAPGSWHVEGMMNEHIVGTALYYLDSENITESHLDFRTITSYFQDDWNVGQDGYHWMESAFGANLGAGAGSSCLQNYGSVNTPQGRLLAFPNVFQHRVSGFKLVDPTKPGHRRFVALWLVDPFTRIISTANVPPQQAEWWSESAFGSLKRDQSSSTVPPEIIQLLLERGLAGSQLAEAMAARGRVPATLPAELIQMVKKELGDDLSMNREEAEEHRLELMEARSSFKDKAKENWESLVYNFCEH